MKSMLKMLTRPTRTLLLALALAAPLCAGAAAGPVPGAIPGEPIQVIIESGNGLTPAGISAKRQNGALEVSGRVEKRYDRRGRIRGHVDVQLLDAQGKVLAERSTALIHLMPSRRNPDYATFLLRLEDVPGEAAAVRVSHREGPRL